MCVSLITNDWLFHLLSTFYCAFVTFTSCPPLQNCSNSETSIEQLDLIKLLTSNSLQVVGDADQSIYSWRGAYAESMSDFVDEFNRYITHNGGSADGKDETMGKGAVNTVFLMENYR